MFGLWLNGSSDGSRLVGNGGELTLGGYTTTHFTESLTWLNIPLMPVASYKYFWALTLSGFTKLNLGSTSATTYSVASNTFAVLDSGTFDVKNSKRIGTTMLIIDTNSFNTIFLGNNPPFLLTQRSGVYILDCGNINTGPTFTLYLNNVPFPITRNISSWQIDSSFSKRLYHV